MPATKQFDYSKTFYDSRLDTRCQEIATNMFINGSAVIQQFANSRDEVVGSCRFFNNERVSREELLIGLTRNVKRNVKGKVVLCIQDTTEFDFTSKCGRIKKTSLGRITSNFCTGFFYIPYL